MKRSFFIGLSFLFLISFRIFYGLNLDFWNDDERHIYLLGLELFSFKHWPYWGADIVHNSTQIPGALQGLLVGLPFFIAKIPEAPLVFLNILSFGAILLLAYYLRKHFQRFSFISLAAWLVGLPWTLEISTHVYNPSYLLLPSVIFFVSFFESIPDLRQGWVKSGLGFFLMGLSIGVIAQLHLSWPLLLPFVLLSFWFDRGSVSAIAKGAVIFSLGFLLPSLLTIPTIAEFGFQSVFQMKEHSQWHLANLGYIFHNLVRLLCYASYESYLFLGETFEEKKEFLKAGTYLLPFVVGASLLTTAQLFYFFYSYLKRWSAHSQKVKWTFYLFLIAWGGSSLTFLISSRPPVSRNLYVLLPLMVWCMFFTIDHFVGNHKARKLFFHTIVLLSLLYHGLLATNRLLNFPAHSLYANRTLLTSSIEERDPYKFEVPRFRAKQE